MFAIASVIVFPLRYFPFLDPLPASLWSFAIFSLAFIARPLGTAIFSLVDRRYGKGVKMTLALLGLGTSTVAMRLVPSYDSIGDLSIVVLSLLRIGQGLALGGPWDGLPSLLALSAPKEWHRFYAMVPQLGAPLGLIVASLLFAYLVSHLSKADFLDWGWRYPFFVAFAINVVALFARLRIVVTPEYTCMFQQRELEPTTLRSAIANDGKTILVGAFVPLASFALFHMVTVFPLSWVFLYTDADLTGFLVIEAVAAIFGFAAIVLSGVLADRIGHRRLLFRSATAIAIFSVFAPLAALALSAYAGLFASGLYLLSGAVCTILALHFARKLEFGKSM